MNLSRISCCPVEGVGIWSYPSNIIHGAGRRRHLQRGTSLHYRYRRLSTTMCSHWGRIIHLQIQVHIQENLVRSKSSLQRFHWKSVVPDREEVWVRAGQVDPMFCVCRFKQIRLWLGTSFQGRGSVVDLQAEFCFFVELGMWILALIGLLQYDLNLWEASSMFATT